MINIFADMSNGLKRQTQIILLLFCEILCLMFKIHEQHPVFICKALVCVCVCTHTLSPLNFAYTPSEVRTSKGALRLMIEQREGKRSTRKFVPNFLLSYAVAA